MGWFVFCGFSFEMEWELCTNEKFITIAVSLCFLGCDFILDLESHCYYDIVCEDVSVRRAVTSYKLSKGVKSLLGLNC